MGRFRTHSASEAGCTPPTLVSRCVFTTEGSDGAFHPIAVRYINAGGKPTEAIGFISENYRGYAQMANLVGSWMQLVGDVPPSADAGAANHAAGSSSAGAWCRMHNGRRENARGRLRVRRYRAQFWAELRLVSQPARPVSFP
jgi:hypothetical protein